MNKLSILFLCFMMFSCLKNEIVQNNDANTDPLVDANGINYMFLSTDYTQFCTGRKTCFFLKKYNGTIWADSDNYYSDFSDIKFALLGDYGQYFISFFDIDSVTSYCKGWKRGETTLDGLKWNIRIKKDELDEFWFDLQYYGASDEIEYTITHKYKVIDSLLHFSTNEGETFIFHPSEKDYTQDILNTNEIIITEGCFFY